MKKVASILLFLFVFGSVAPGFADAKKKKGVTPDGPVVATWSKIKELFE